MNHWWGELRYSKYRTPSIRSNFGLSATIFLEACSSGGRLPVSRYSMRGKRSGSLCCPHLMSSNCRCVSEVSSHESSECSVVTDNSMVSSIVGFLDNASALAFFFPDQCLIVRFISCIVSQVWWMDCENLEEIDRLHGLCTQYKGNRVCTDGSV